MNFKSFSAAVVGLALLVTPSVLPAFAQEQVNPTTTQEEVTPSTRESTATAKLSKPKSVSLSSGDGSASGTITWAGTKNFNYQITLKSKKGKRVYIQAKGYRDFAPDSSWRRMTGNTTSKKGQLFSGSFSGGGGELKWTGVYLRICNDISFKSDKCGAYQNIGRQ